MALGALISQAGPVNALAVGIVDGTPIAVSGGADGMVRLWDLKIGTARGQLKASAHAGPVTALAIGHINGTAVAASGDDSGAISMWTLGRDQRLSAHLVAPSGVRAIACAGQMGWLTAINDRSLFNWLPASASLPALQ
jgi:WD40 repeat protein